MVVSTRREDLVLFGNFNIERAFSASLKAVSFDEESLFHTRTVQDQNHGKLSAKVHPKEVQSLSSIPIFLRTLDGIVDSSPLFLACLLPLSTTPTTRGS